MAAYITAADIAARVSAKVLLQCYDDANTGTADAAAVAQLCLDAQSYVDGFLRGIYSYAMPFATVPNEIKRLTLDVAVGYLRERHPEYVRSDGGAAMKRVRQDLEDLRMGKTRLDIYGAPENAANEGGKVGSGVLDDTEDPVKFFVGGTGIF